MAQTKYKGCVNCKFGLPLDPSHWLAAAEKISQNHLPIDIESNWGRSASYYRRAGAALAAATTVSVLAAPHPKRKHN